MCPLMHFNIKMNVAVGLCARLYYTKQMHVCNRILNNSFLVRGYYLDYTELSVFLQTTLENLNSDGDSV